MARYSGPSGGGALGGAGVVDPGTGVVYATGTSYGTSSADDFATVAYDPTGAQLWAERYNGIVSGSGNDEALGVGVDPATHDILVTGRSVADTGHWNYATVAYSCGC